MSNQHSTVYLGNTPASNASLYKFYMAQAQGHARRASEHYAYGHVARAKLEELNQQKNEAKAALYAVVPWCPIARAAFIHAGPGHVATGERYAAWCVKRVEVSRG